jgi:mannose-6-phosphate isomerase
MAEKLDRVLVQKPWGVRQLPSPFHELRSGGASRIGEIWFPAPAGKPMDLLVKYLFTRENLSIQVHPNAIQAEAKGLTGGKDECWYILSAEPDAVVGIGTARPLSAEELREASISGEIEQLMTWYPARAGMLFHIPAGTVHCIGAGVSLIELQQNIDVTYRLYDFGRNRGLHLDDGVEVSRAEPFPANQQRDVAPDESGLLLANEHFALGQICGDSHWPWDATGMGDQITIIPVVGNVTADGLTVGAGECALIRADSMLDMSAGTRAFVAWTKGRG